MSESLLEKRRGGHMGMYSFRAPRVAGAIAVGEAYQEALPLVAEAQETQQPQEAA